jgi:hypothetical protein
MNKRNIIIYVSGKYSGEIDNNIQIARHFAIKIWEMGYTTLCPHLNTAHFEQDCKCGYDDYIQGDLVMLECCNGIFLLPYWEESSGAKLELAEATNKRIKVFTELQELQDFNWGKHYDG